MLVVETNNVSFSPVAKLTERNHAVDSIDFAATNRRTRRQYDAIMILLRVGANLPTMQIRKFTRTIVSSETGSGMIGEVIRLPRRNGIGAVNVRSRLESMASIFHAIEAGELLVALPDCPLARANHTTALKLLALIETELNSLCHSLGEEISDQS